MSERARGLWITLGLVLAWRLVLLVLTSQPVPSNDSFFYDGPVVNWLKHGHYCNPPIAECFPICGHELFSAYPPVYQGVLLAWMGLFGASVISAMAMHWVFFALNATLAVLIIRAAWPALTNATLAVCLLLAITFNDRPDDVAHFFGLAALLLCVLDLQERMPARLAQVLMAILIFVTLSTSPIIGAFYFGVVVVMRAVASLLARKAFPWASFSAVVVVFAGVTCFIARAWPEAWRGFLENAAQQSAAAGSLRKPTAGDLLKLTRNAPVFLAFAVCLPALWSRRAQWATLAAREPAAAGLTLGAGVVGLILLAATQVLLSPNYVMFTLFIQVVLGAGLLWLGQQNFPEHRLWFRGTLAGCVLLVSVRAVGMSTWGVLCARDVSRQKAEQTLAAELQPYRDSEKPIVLSSAYLYQAAAANASGAIHSDWLRDRRVSAPDADFNALCRLRPSLLLLTQFDYYRSYAPTVEMLKARPDLVTVSLRNVATTRPPDAIPSLQRVVQHISWAPVVVQLDWK